MACPPTEPFTSADHHREFREFIRLETAVGGPDPHLATLGKMIEGQPFTERVWRCGLYASGYNVPTAEAIWKAWPWERMKDELASGDGLHAWVAQHWGDGIGLRRERRAVRTVAKFSRCLLSIADFTEEVTTNVPDWWGVNTHAAYESAWKATGEVYGLGRYVQLKFVEALARYADGQFFQTDIRANGGTSPREGLALLFPTSAEWLLKTGNVEKTERVAAGLRERVSEDLGFDVPFFTLQVVLCEYKKVFQGKQYPGRTHDTELKYWRAIQRYWGFESDMLPARKELFLPVSLGEEQGWWQQRESLEETLPRFRYQWSDLLYDFDRTLDSREPFVRPEPLRGINGEVMA